MSTNSDAAMMAPSNVQCRAKAPRGRCDSADIKPLYRKPISLGRLKPTITDIRFIVVLTDFVFLRALVTVRYRGLAKNTHRLVVTSALANLFIARRHLLGCQQA
jgi:hypothetical protein